MAAQTITDRQGHALIQRLKNLHAEITGSGAGDIRSDATTTLTLVFTTSTEAITLDVATT